MLLSMSNHYQTRASRRQNGVRCTLTIVQRLQAARRDLSLIGALDKLDKFDLIVLADLAAFIAEQQRAIGAH